MKPVKVLHIANIDTGLKIHLGNYMRYQRAQGYDVTAVTHPGRWLPHDTTILDGIFVKVIPFEPRLSPVADLKTLIRLARFFRREKFDIVHTHAVKPGLLGRLAAKLVGVPIIIHTVHGFYFYEGMAPVQYRIYVLIEKLGAACCNLILSQNKADIETAIREKICAPDKIFHLGNGIDLSLFDPDHFSSESLANLRLELNIPPQQAIVGFAARLVREKGILEFFEAASILKSKGIKATYLVIGTPQKGKTSAVSPEALLKEYGLEEDLLLLGYRDDIPELLSLMDIVVLPSHGREGIPRILMESAALGKPVVATRVRGNVEAVEDGQTGLLTPVRDAPALADAILSLLRDSPRAAAMGQNARQRALTCFDERNFFWKTDRHYRQLIKNELAIDTRPLLKPIPTGQYRR